VLIALLAPFAVWLSRPSRELKVFIVDKTVAESSGREHAGLTWLLNHRKYFKPGGVAYDRDQDYYGFVPGPDHSWEAREPSIRKAAPELIYLADTYGVYTEEFYGLNRGNRTQLIYGGLRDEEAKGSKAPFPVAGPWWVSSMPSPALRRGQPGGLVWIGLVSSGMDGSPASSRISEGISRCRHGLS